jgi:hypothetical protein
MKNLSLHSLVLAMAVYGFALINVFRSIVKKNFLKNLFHVRFLSVIVGLVLTVNIGFGQLTLSGTSYTQNFNGSTTMAQPTGWTVVTSASAVSLGTTATFPSATTTWASTTGAFGNYASLDAGLASSATTATQAAATDRALGVRQSSATGFDPGAAFVLHLTNTSGLQSFSYSFKLMQMDISGTAGRTTTWNVDYGFGATPTSFTNATTSPVTLTTVLGGGQTSTNVTVNFGNALDNKSGDVWIRISTTAATSGSGSRPATAIDDVRLTWAAIALSKYSYSGFTYVAGSGPSTSQPDTVSASGLSPASGTLTVAGSTDYEVSTDNSSFGSSKSISYSGGALSATPFYIRLKAGLSAGNYNNEFLSVSGGGAPTKSDTASGFVSSPGVPTIITSGNSLSSFGTVVAGQSSAEKSYTVSGTNLTGNIVVIAPSGIEITQTSGSYTGITGDTIRLTPTSGSVSTTTIYAEFKPASGIGAFSGTIKDTSSGAVEQDVTVSGKGIATEPTVPRTISFGTVTTSSVVVNFSNTNAGNGNKRLVIVKTSAITGADVPVDGTTYTANTTFGSGSVTSAGTYVVYASTGSTTTVTGLAGGTKYYFAVYEYNDNSTAGAENYLTSTYGYDSSITSVASYTWSGGSGVWTTAANWTPTRSNPGTTDILQFTSGTVTVTGVPSETDGQLLISGATVSLQASGTNTLTISGGTGTDLTVDGSSWLTVSGSNPLTIVLNSGVTGSINGHITITGSGHIFKAASASGITFQSGSVFNDSTGATAAAFGSSGTANSIVFTSGSEYIHGTTAGNPFQLTAPSSLVVFNHGSTFLLTAVSSPSFSGRTYGNFIYKPTGTGTVPTTSGGSAFSVDTMTILGNFNMGQTGAASIKGNLNVGAGDTLNFSASSGTDTVAFNGSVPQTITSLGAISFASTEALEIANSTGVSLGSNLSLGKLILASGDALTIGSNTLTLIGAVSGSGTLTGSSTSNLTVLGAAGTLNFTGGFGVLKDLVLNTSTSATLGTALDITAGSSPGSVTVGSGATLTTGGNLTMKSDNNGTSWVGNSAGTISGNVTVERYIPADADRAWRLLSIPTQTTQTIHQSWQEGWAPGGGAPGLGTNITSPIAGWAAAGFDAQSYSSSMLTYKPSTNTWDSIINTGNTIATTSGYFLYVRGDRSEMVSGSASSTNFTTLRTTGTLYQGTQTAISVTGGQFGLIGNIYASAIDFTALTKGAGIDNKFYVWDPKVLNLPPSLGAYVTFSSITTPAYEPVPGGGSYTSGVANTLIQSGQAFFVHATSTATVQLTEASKATGSANVFRPESPSNESGQLSTNLYEVSGSSAQMADGNVEVFNSAYSDAVDGNDALKLSNTQENFGILRSSNVLIIEARQPVTTTDTIFFKMWNMKQQQYKMEFVPSNLNTTGLTAVLEDSYLGTKTPVDLTNTNSVLFTVDGNAGSSASNRFMVVLNNNSSPVAVSFTGISAQQAGTGIEVGWKVTGENGIQQYIIERSTNGSSFSQVGVTTAKGNNGGAISYSLQDGTATTGTYYYRILSVGVNGAESYTATVKVTIGAGKPSITIYPNPVADGHISVQLTNQSEGVYSLRLLTVTGQSVFKGELVHGGGSGTQTVNLPAYLSKGTYQLEVISPANEVHTQKLTIINKN